MPRSIRGENSDGFHTPAPLYEYKPPSIFAEHRGVAIVFAILLLAVAVYWARSFLARREPAPAPAAVAAPPPAQSVYIEVIPPKSPSNP